jgi:cell division protein ZapA
MAQVTLDVNGRPYVVGCEDGQEAHLRELAKAFDGHVRQVSRDLGQLGETRLFLMGALLLADEMVEVKARLAALQTEFGALQSDFARVEARAVAALENAARRIEQLTGEDKAA